jgi:hypothetical protein
MIWSVQIGCRGLQILAASETSDWGWADGRANESSGRLCSQESDIRAFCLRPELSEQARATLGGDLDGEQTTREAFKNLRGCAHALKFRPEALASRFS